MLDQDGASGPLPQNGASLTPFMLTEHTLVLSLLASSAWPLTMQSLALQIELVRFQLQEVFIPGNK